MTTVLEGTWEEIKIHDTVLAGLNVRLIVESEVDFITEMLPDPPNSIHSESHLEDLLLEGLDSGPMTPMTEDDWADLRREGRALALRL